MTAHDVDFPLERAREVVETALDEDLGVGAAVDVTTLATIPGEQRSRAPGNRSSAILNTGSARSALASMPSS